MTYILSSEDRRKLEEALKHHVFASDWHDVAAAALSLLAGLPKVQDDDGDALRLAVKSRFTIKDFAPHDNPDIVQAPPDAALWGMVEIWREDDNDPLHVEWYKAGADRCAVTRRAIERAVAAMKEHPQP